jgi:hypothetical protein
MRFEPGQVVTRRYVRGPWLTWAQPMWVVSDDDAGLLLWHPDGSDYARLIDTGGATLHDTTPDRMLDPKLTVHPWQGDILVLMPPGAAYSIWWFFEDGRFDGWYVNLEEPYVRRPESVDTTDHVLDIVVTAEREWRWKDEDEMARLIGEPHYFDQAKAAAIRAEGERIIKLVEAGEFPFDDTHTGFRPDPSWKPLRLSGF